MVLIKGDRKGGVCRKNEFGVTLPPVSIVTSNEGRTTIREKDVSLYASDVNWSRYGSLVNRHCLEMGGSEEGVGGCTHSYSAAGCE